MSRDIRQHWQEVRAIEGTLPEFVWLVSVAANSLSFVTEAPAAVAARLLKIKSHRLATSEEVEAHHAREAESAKQALHERMRRLGAAVVVVASSSEPALAPAALATSEPFPRPQH